MGKTRMQKGLTLIGLVVIIVLVIVMISLITSGGEILVGEITINDLKSDKMLTKDTNTIAYDDYGNKIVLPVGFKLKIDASTNYADDVTEGIVIVDSNGNEFVWVPIGKIYTDEKQSKYETITLGRYTFSLTSGEHTLYQPTDNKYIETLVEIPMGSYNYVESNDIQSIKKFYSSAIKNGGYYIGRYEAGNYNQKLVSKKYQTIYNNITQEKALDLSKKMYDNKKFSSSLVNSYAWDTAILFIQTFSREIDANNYSNLNKSWDMKKTGENQDEYCNINDMSGNASEWSTEIIVGNENATVNRGGYYPSRIRLFLWLYISAYKY